MQKSQCSSLCCTQLIMAVGKETSSSLPTSVMMLVLRNRKTRYATHEKLMKSSIYSTSSFPTLLCSFPVMELSFKLLVICGKGKTMCNRVNKYFSA